jgi:uncharacterized repeat protein (TIGR01451 family)
MPLTRTRMRRRARAELHPRTIVACAVILGSLACATSASAAGTVLFDQPFQNNTVNGPAGSVALPATPTKSNVACLSAAGNATANPLASCAAPDTDAQGAGFLRLTSIVGGAEGGVFATTSVPTSQGLDVIFNAYMYGGSNPGADGLAFALAAVDPANPATPSVLGASGGSLGYSHTGSTAGLSRGYLGIGLDSHGNFSSSVYEGTGCTDPPNMTGRVPGQIAVRGPGHGAVGYCALKSTAATSTSPPLALRAATRAASKVPVEVAYNPSTSAVTTSSGLAVPARSYVVKYTPVGGTAKTLAGTLPTVPAGLYPASWVDASGYPKQLAFGWVGSTGSVTDFHEIGAATVTTMNPVPLLAVSQTSYAATTSIGSPVTYTVTASSSGVAEHSPVTVTETLPAGIVPVSASGSGWVCGAPIGQQISCTNSTNPFTSGTITVNGVVNSGSVSSALIQTSTAVISSGDGGPASSLSATAGTVPLPPILSVIGPITPTNGPAGGNNAVTIAGLNLGGATAIEIGTAAQFTAGTPTTVVVCSGGLPAGCFTIDVTGTSISIPSMPPHLAGAVQVKVVSLGIADIGTYTYNPGPALLVATSPPSGEVAVAYTSYQFVVTGGTSPFIWSVSAGSLPPGLSLSTAGLLTGTPTTAGTYPFTVRVLDNAGLSDTAAVSVSIIPGPSLTYPATLPGGWTHTVYGTTLTESGGTGPFAWTISSGTLPTGLSLSPSGTISGTPTATGTSSFTVKVTDALGQFATQATSLTVSAGVSITSGAPPAGAFGVAYSTTLTATGGTTPYTWSQNDGTLPPGLTLSSSGVLSGTPTSANGSPYTFSVNVIDANNGIATQTIDLVITGLRVTSAAPAAARIGVTYSTTFVATGGPGTQTWSAAAGSLPPGLTLNASTGVLSGTPTAVGTTTFTIRVATPTQNATKLVTFVVGPAASVTSSAGSVTYGTPVTLTAHVNPVAATGTVTFRTVPSTGPQSGQTITLGTATLSSGTASLTTTLTAFNANAISIVYSGDATYAADTSPAIAVHVSAYAGEVIVNQLRLSGPSGANDQFVELYNAGPAVSLGGFRVSASSGVTHVVPASAPVLATGRSYLVSGGTYSLGAIATPDSSATHLGSKGVKVEAPDATLTVVDAVGETGALTGYFSGVPLPLLSGTPTHEYGWVRLETAGRPTNTNSNATDFRLVSANGGVVGGVQSMLGSPSPSASASAFQQNATLQSVLLDPSVSSTAAPNRVSVAGTPGRLTVRRKIMNSSATTVTTAKVRLTSLSEANGAPLPGVATQPANPARLRAVNPLTATSQVTLTGGTTVTVQNLAVDPPAAGGGLGGGLNSTLSIPLSGGLAADASVNVAFTFAVDTGGTFWFGYDVDALGGAAGFAAAGSGFAPAAKQQAGPAPSARAPSPPEAGASGQVR